LYNEKRLSFISNTKPGLSDFLQRWASKQDKMIHFLAVSAIGEKRYCFFSERQTAFFFIIGKQRKQKAFLDHFVNRSVESEEAFSTLWKQLSFLIGGHEKKEKFSCKNR
jgi:hypothetical protein